MPTPAPLANPPGTIGPFTNVPQPGSPIRSDWPIQASTLITGLLTRQGLAISATPVTTTGQNLVIPWTAESSDTDGFHAANSTDIIIPAGLGGVYVASLSATPSPAPAGLCTLAIDWAGLLFGAHIPATGTTGFVTWMSELNTGHVVKAQIFNGHSASVTWNARLRMFRVSP